MTAAVELFKAQHAFVARAAAKLRAEPWPEGQDVAVALAAFFDAALGDDYSACHEKTVIRLLPTAAAILREEQPK